MTKENQMSVTRSTFGNVLEVFRCLSARRRFQVGLLFAMQLTTAALEILSIGSIIPFLTALTDVKKLMQNPYIIFLMDEMQITDPQNLIVVLALAFSAGIIFANIARFFTMFLQQYLSAGIAVDLGNLLFFKTLHKPYLYFLNHNSSELIGNTTNDLNGVLGTIYCFFSIMTQGLVSIFIVTGLLVYNTGIALILAIIIMVLYAMTMLFVSRRLRANSRVSSDSYRRSLQALQEGFGGIRYILLGRLQESFTWQFRVAERKYRHKNAENNVIQQTPKLFLESLGVLAISIITITHTAQHKDISTIIPLVGFLVFSSYRLLPAVQQIYASISGIMALSVSLKRVVDVISVPLDANVSRLLGQPLQMDKTLTFKNVYFDYSGTEDNWTIEDVSFEVKAKSTIALVGHTGSGKSTISDLILGLIEPQRGEILIDGVPLCHDNLPEWQAAISHVPQNIFLSDATIAENIAFGIPSDQIDMAQVKKAAAAAQVSAFIESLPDGYAQRCGERGVRLSGGQRQRIGIARALYQKASLIVFDEATSALDNKTEQEVVKAIDILRENITAIVIAHRVSTFKNADHILVFEKGRLVAQGTYQDLLGNPYFANLTKDVPREETS